MDLAEQLKTGVAAAKNIKPLKLFENSRLVICGMGGSIMPAEALSMLWLDQPTIYINRTAYLPHWTDSRHLVICISWSGQTAETIACFEEAVTKNIPIAVITTGGRLAEMAQKENIPLVLLPPHGLNPRDALGLMFSALLTLISRSDIIENSIKSSLFSKTAGLDSAADLAQRIEQKTPLLYSSYPWRFLGSWWKIFFNENAKIHAFCNCLPGAAHNEIAGITKQDSRFFYLLLQDHQDHPADNKTIDQLAKFLKAQQTDYEVVILTGQNRLEKVFNQYLLASAVSVELAHSLGVDPHSTETIESFKRLS